MAPVDSEVVGIGYQNQESLRPCVSLPTRIELPGKLSKNPNDISAVHSFTSDDLQKTGRFRAQSTALHVQADETRLRAILA